MRAVAATGVPRQLNIARAGTLLVAVEALNVLVGFGATVYFARTLGATALGVFFLFQAALSTASIVADFGLRGAVEKRLSEGDDPGEFLAAGLLLKTGLLVVVCAAVWLLRAPVAAYVGADLTPELVVTTVVYELATLAVFVLRAELRAGETAFLYFLRLFVYVCLGVGAVTLGYGVRGLVDALAASYAVLLVGGLLRASTPLAVPDGRHVRSLLAYAKYNGIWGLGGYVYTTLDVLVVGYFLTRGDVGAYQIAASVATVTTVVATVLADTIFAQLSAWRARDEIDRVRETLRDALTASFAVVVPAFFGVAVLGREILGVLFGPAYAVAGTAFAVLMVAKVVTSADVILDAAVRAFDRPDAGAFATAGSLTTNVVLNVVLVPRYGLVGAAAATAASIALNTAVLAWVLRGLTTVEVAVRDVAWCVGASAVMAGVLLALRPVLSPTTLPGLVASVALGGVVYAAAASLSPSLRSKALGVAGGLR